MSVQVLKNTVGTHRNCLINMEQRMLTLLIFPFSVCSRTPGDRLLNLV